MKIVAVNGNRVLIHQDQNVKTETDSGLIIPGTVRMTEETGLQKHITTGTILNVGSECKWGKFGDKVLFSISDCAPIEYEVRPGHFEKYLVIREPQIVFAFEGDSITKINTDRVLLEPDPMEKMTESGLFIPENASFAPITGVVIGVGQDCKHVKALDHILFGNMAGQIIEFKGKSYMCVREADVVAVMEQEVAI
jgi:chaperonin GroES